jgi:hypothetical protein
MNLLFSASVRRRLVPFLWTGSTALYIALAIYTNRVTERWHQADFLDYNCTGLPVMLILPLAMTGSYARQVRTLDSLDKNVELRSRVSVALAAVVFVSYLTLLIGMIAVL